MWTKTVFCKIKGFPLQPVQVWLDDTDQEGREVVKIQAMMNELYITETVLFGDREAVYDYIKHYSKDAGESFLERHRSEFE